MRLNYEYYLPYLKNVSYTKKQDREMLNNLLKELNYVIEEFNISYENYVTEYNLLEDMEEPTTTNMELLHNTLRNKQLIVVDISIQLIPYIRYYVNSYSKKSIDNKVLHYLTEIQFDYVYVIRNLMHEEISAISQISNLKNIMQKSILYNKNMTNTYISNFLSIYDVFYIDYFKYINIFAENYYKAPDKFSYKESLTDSEKAQVQDFYNFLEQPSYN